MTFDAWPHQIQERRAYLYQAVVEYGSGLGHESGYIESLFNLLPPALQAAMACKLIDPLDWAYDFGSPIDRMPKGVVVGGTPEGPRLVDLYDALVVASRHLGPQQLEAWSARLEDRGKHMDAVEEMRPLTFLRPEATSSFEVEGMGVGAKLIDWYIKQEGGPPLLFDVKYRRVDTVEHFKAIIPLLNAGKREIPEPDFDPALLFRDTYQKFEPRAPSVVLQGAWIRCGIKHPCLQDYFDTLPAEQIHFAILPGVRGQAEVFARTVEQESRVRSVLGLKSEEEK
jgi:hypothetical protein